MSDPWLFVAAVLTLLGTPGPTNTLLATSGAAIGIRRSLPALAGELTGYLIAIVAVRLALAPVIHAYPLLGTLFKVAVALYLVWTAVRLWQRGAALTGGASRVTVLDVFITTLLNPKALIFALSIIPLEHPHLPWYFAGFALLVPVVGSGWIAIGWAIGAASGARHAGLIQRVASVALLGFAGLIAASAFG